MPFKQSISNVSAAYLQNNLEDTFQTQKSIEPFESVATQPKGKDEIVASYLEGLYEYFIEQEEEVLYDDCDQVIE